MAIVAALCLPGSNAVAQVSQSDIQSVSDGGNAFAVNLYAQLARESGDNIFFSPYSISSAMGMVYAGARNGTARQIDRVMHFTLPDDRLHPALGALTNQLNAGAMDGNVAAYKLKVANSLWGQTGYPYKQHFLNILQQYYGAALQQTDFENNPTAAVQQINQWVSDATHNRIPTILDSLDPTTRLVLVDAIYFKSGWLNQFDATNTEQQPFNVDEATSAQAPLMYQQEWCQYAENANAQIVEIPYAAHKLSMVVILPKEPAGLSDVEAKLTPQRLSNWLSHTGSRSVNLYLPKFTFTDSIDLMAELKSLGIVKAFDRDVADFAGITLQDRLYISKAVHKAFVAVDETGTEAAAATALVVSIDSIVIDSNPPTFRADHPFIFLIRDNATGTILFMGRVTNPTAN